MVARSRGGAEAEQLRRVVDERRRRLAGLEGRVADEVQQERDVGLDAADAELAQRAVGALRRFFERRAPGRDLDEQRIEVRRDDRAAEAVAAVETHGEAAGRPVGRDAAVVGDEVAIGIFGRDAALHGHAAALDRCPARGMPTGGSCSVWPCGDEDLAAHQVDAGDHFGDRVLDLDARVDLDEEELAAVDVEQELDRARAAVVDRAAQARRRARRCASRSASAD